MKGEEHTGSFLSALRKCNSSGQDGSGNSSDGETHFDS